ncbi:RidA family protein [Streptomyces sp. NPDC050619]|uniref:RidA family protein n=1 Tax=Streptomyces sp. NPDC050619 TaxID=3157214 RepID=UPI00342A5779
MERLAIGSGSRAEEICGYSRVVRVGESVAVAGTTAISEGDIPDDLAEQTRICLRRVIDALDAVGCRVGDVVRTRFFVTDITDWQAVGRVHREVFADTRPAMTLVEVARLFDERLLVEVEVDAISPGDDH